MLTANSKPNIIVTDRGVPFILSEQERSDIEHSMHHYEDPRAASIDALKIVQKNHRWVSDSALFAIADVLGVPAADLEGVATFYNRIYRQPVGRHVIAVCDSIACFLTGFDQLYGALQTHLNIKPGQTTADDRFTLLPICCLGACDRSPVLMINDDTHFDVTPQRISEILESYI
ncbi:MAG: NADH-quinone oxidoreductase subunit NuoE [Pseudomonadota bacterium]